MIYILGIITAIIVGLAAKYAADHMETDFQITRNELFIGAAVCSLIAVPATVAIGTHIAKSSNLTYREFWNGYEVKAVKDRRVCSRDSGCTYTYSCDPYTVTRTGTRTVSDGNGGTSTETYTYTETEWHSCPYADRQESFVVKTTLGDYDMGTRVPHDAKQYRSGERIPGSIPRGEPKMWRAAADRIAAGKNGPVTKRMDYDNYILASQNTILLDYSDAIDKYKKAKLLPKLSNNVENYYLADKFYTVGLKVPNDNLWEDTVGRFNAAFGSTLYGDMHFVLFDLKDINDPNEYAQALYAYWQSDAFKRDALSKNALVVLAGTETGETVDWAGAVTGMPVGNTLLLQEIRADLRGLPLDPVKVIGRPAATFKGDKVEKVMHPDEGKLEMLAWGTNKFERVSMSGSDKNDSGTGFGYLAANVELTGNQQAAIFFVSLLTSGIVWAILLAVGDPRQRSFQTWRNRNNRRF